MEQEKIEKLKKRFEATKDICVNFSEARRYVNQRKNWSDEKYYKWLEENKAKIKKGER